MIVDYAKFQAKFLLSIQGPVDTNFLFWEKLDLSSFLSIALRIATAHNFTRR